MLDERVLFPRIALARHFDEGGVDHLSGARHIAACRQLFTEACKQLRHQVQFLQPFAVQPDRVGVRHAVFYL